MTSKINKMFLSLCNFYENNGIGISPFPTLIINTDKNDIFDISIKTAEYDIKNNKIIVYVYNRHLKDILRSISHELYHHHQNILNHKMMEKIEHSNIENMITARIEMDAYQFGNIMFRKWCNQLKISVNNKNEVFYNDNDI